MKSIRCPYLHKEHQRRQKRRRRRRRRREKPNKGKTTRHPLNKP